MKDEIPDSILMEAIAIMEELKILRNTSLWQHKKVEEFSKKYTDDEVEKLGWEEKERLYKLTDELAGRLYGTFKELKRLTGKYEKLRVRLEQEYGDTRLPKVNKNEKDLNDMWRDYGEGE